MNRVDFVGGDFIAVLASVEMGVGVKMLVGVGAILGVILEQKRKYFT